MGALSDRLLSTHPVGAGAAGARADADGGASAERHAVDVALAAAVVALLPQVIVHPWHRAARDPRVPGVTKTMSDTR